MASKNKLIAFLKELATGGNESIVEISIKRLPMWFKVIVRVLCGMLAFYVLYPFFF